jgi:tetratricopeptide (TPR) repeat protein
LSAINGKDWAFSLRWLVDRETGWPICRDEWDSLGPGKGINLARFGGFISPSNLMLNKDTNHFLFPLWSLSAFPDGTGEDRLIFSEMQKKPNYKATNQYTCYYEIPADVQRHPHHAAEFSKRHIRWIVDRTQIDLVNQYTAQARADFDKSDYASALDHCGRVLAIHPYFVPALGLLAQIEIKKGNPKGAMEYLDRALAIDDFDPGIVALKAELADRA